MNTNYALLGLLNNQASYGYELKQIYDSLFESDRPLAYGQVYATLSRLKRDGKISEIAHSGKKSNGGPDRHKYEITDAGKQSLNQWLLRPEKPAPYLQATLYLKTVLSLLLGDEAKQYLDVQQSAHIERMRELTIMRRQDTDISKKLLIDFMIYHLEADLRWIDVTISRLKALKQEVSRAC